MSASVESRFSIEEFLTQEQGKDLLRFSTAGSVDDGKSTLIGRLLYDTRSVYEDHVRSIEGKGATAKGQIDFALLTDGLRAEREQGITIDVAYRYFATATRKYIIADTPGHEQYTRNMATGASTATATVVLIDAGKGVMPQSRRHAFIASLLRVSHVIVAVNKIDLVQYSEDRFREIEKDFRQVLDNIARETGNTVSALFVPVSALLGDNVAQRSENTPWYGGPSLLELLESLPATQGVLDAPFRFSVQRVVRPDRTFRGFAGQIASGVIRVGDAVTVQPSGNPARIERIVTFDGDLQEAFAPQSITLVLDREVDISRGDLIAASDAPAQVVKSAKASLVWMDQRALEVNRRYLVKHASQTLPAYISSVRYRANIATLEHESAQSLGLNDIGVVNLDFLRPIALDTYGANRITGAFVVIDPESNGTVAAGMITALDEEDPTRDVQSWSAEGPVLAAERAARWGHRGAVLEVNAPVELIHVIERSVLQTGAVVIRVEADSDAYLLHPSLLDVVTKTLVDAGAIALVARSADGESAMVRLEGKESALDASDAQRAIASVHRLLDDVQVFHATERAGL